MRQNTLENQSRERYEGSSINSRIRSKKFREDSFDYDDDDSDSIEELENSRLQETSDFAIPELRQSRSTIGNNLRDCSEHNVLTASNKSRGLRNTLVIETVPIYED